MFLIYKELIQILKKNTKIQTDKQAKDRNKVFMLEDIPTVKKHYGKIFTLTVIKK